MSTGIGRWRALTEALYVQSADQKLKWTINDDKSIFADIAEKRITLREKESGNFETDIQVEITKDNWLVDSFDDTNLRGLKPRNVKANTYYKVMTDILSMGKRQANGADQTLDAILAELGTSEIKEDPADLDDDVPF